MSKQQAVKIANEMADVLNKCTTNLLNTITQDSDPRELKNNLSIVQSSLNISAAILAL